jgi:AraC family transcriptional regulator, carnitine catabolism transcriptional activator
METMRKKRDTRPEADRQRLEKAADFYLHACYGTRTPARAEEFAQFVQRARPYLSRRVVELIGMPLSDYLRSKQLAHAERLLRTTPLSVEQVAMASAFGSEWTFHRRFKAAFGVTPAAYRLRNVSR